MRVAMRPERRKIERLMRACGQGKRSRRMEPNGTERNLFSAQIEDAPLNDCLVLIDRFNAVVN